MAANYFYWLLSLQTWIFAIKYLTSAMNSSLNVPLCLTHTRIHLTFWFVTAFYILTLIILIIVLLISFPGYLYNNSVERYLAWYETTCEKILNITVALWLLLNLVSIGISIFAVSWFSNTVKLLRF